MPGSDLPREPGLQADRRRGEARHTRQPGGANGATSKSSRTSSTRPTAPKTTRCRARTETSSPRSSSSSPTRRARAAGRPPARKSPATTSCTTPSGPAPAGSQTGTTRAGAPDALLLGARPTPLPEDESNPPLYDYSNDFYLDAGRRNRQGAPAPQRRHRRLSLRADRDTTPQSQVHRWVTDPMAENFKMTEKRDARVLHPIAERRTLSRASSASTFSNATKSGPRRSRPTPCSSTRQSGAKKNPYWTYTAGRDSPAYWPQFKWERVRLTMTLQRRPLYDPRRRPARRRAQRRTGNQPRPTRSRSCTTTP